jgi:hypothetical protein
MRRAMRLLFARLRRPPTLFLGGGEATPSPEIRWSTAFWFADGPYKIAM